MGKWLKRILKPTDSVKSNNHCDLEDLARLVEGTLDGAARKRILRHLCRCEKCYEILQETLKDASAEGSQIPDPTVWWKRKSVYALAASIIMIFIIGGQLIEKYRTQYPKVISTKLILDQELKNILLENNDLHWKNAARIERLISALYKRGFQVKPLNRVVLSRPYYQTKSLFGPKEILHIRIEDDVVYLEVEELK